MKNYKGLKVRLLLLSGLLIAFLCLVNLYPPNSSTAAERQSIIARRVNVPDSSGLFEPSIFWFGKVDPTSNYADVRMWYHETHLELTVHIIDRQLWQSTTPAAANLTQWDAVSLYFNLDGNQGSTPSQNSYRLITQLGATEADGSYQIAYRGNGSSWVETPLAYTAFTEWRGAGGPNTDADNKGWQLTVAVPFSSLNLPASPSPGTTWGLAVIVHDRDDAAGSPIPDQVWPEQIDPTSPATWGQLHFGRAAHISPPALPTGSTIIRHGLHDASIVDGHVGGHTTCGDGLDHWSEWGEANYAGYTQINIQNQWDISDYPCFSKYYVTLPLDSIPPDTTIISAQLAMTLFGNAGGDPWPVPQDSFVHALTVAEDWNEATLTWNNAPLPVENISGTWVKPVQLSDQREYKWDVSGAVVQALVAGDPLRLALYSIDGERHSGKYFYSSDTNDWDGTVRPTLEIVWGEPCAAPDVQCTISYLPVVQK